MTLYITFFNIASTAAFEKPPLSYQMPQSVRRPHSCGVQNLPLKMRYGGEKLEINTGRYGQILSITNSILLFGSHTMVQRFIKID